MRAFVLRNRLRIGALRGFRAPTAVPAAESATAGTLTLPSAQVLKKALSPPTQNSFSNLTPSGAALSEKSVSSAACLQRVSSGCTPPCEPLAGTARVSPLLLAPSASSSTPSPTSSVPDGAMDAVAGARMVPVTLAAAAPLTIESPSFAPGADDAAVAAEWERPLNDNQEDLYMLLSSPARPATPSHGAAPPYPLRHPTPPNASPLHAVGPQHSLAMLRIPPPSPLRGPSPRGEQRAMVEWAVASSRHASPWRAPSPRMQSPALHSPLMQGLTGPIASAAAASSRSAGSQGLPSSFLMPPPPLPLERGSSLGDMDVSLRIERPSTDPRSSPAWPGPAFGVPAGRSLLLLDRPATDPRASPSSQLNRFPAGSKSSNSSILGTFGQAGFSQDSPARAMLPPPPRKPSDKTGAAPSDSTLTDDDIESFLEAGSFGLSQQYGSMHNLADLEGASSHEVPNGDSGANHEQTRHGNRASAHASSTSEGIDDA